MAKVEIRAVDFEVDVDVGGGDVGRDLPAVDVADKGEGREETNSSEHEESAIADHAHVPGTCIRRRSHPSLLALLPKEEGSLHETCHMSFEPARCQVRGNRMTNRSTKEQERTVHKKEATETGKAKQQPGGKRRGTGSNRSNRQR